VEKAGDFSVSLLLMVAGNKKIYSDVATYTVQKNIGIGTIKFFTTSPDQTSVNVIRDMIGTAAQYKIEYGTNEANLNQSNNVVTNELVLENLNPEQEYFIKISPLDAA
jgi:hypothetical protein